MRRGRVVVAIVLLAASLAACGGSTRASSSSGEVVVGALYPTHGSQGAGGTQELHGVQLAVDWANAHGGIHGKRIDLKVEGVTTREDVPAAVQRLRDAHAVTIIGSHGSVYSAIAATEVAQQGPVFFETGAVGMLDTPSAAGRNFFRLAPSGASLGRAGIDFVHDVLLPQRHETRVMRYAVAYVDDPYGRAVGGGARDEILSRHLPLVATVHYDAATIDATAIARQLAAAHTDVLFVAAYLDDGIALRRALVAQHVRLAAAVGTSSSFCMPQFGARLGAAAIGLFASDKLDADHVRLSALKPSARRVLSWAETQYRARYHTSMSAYALSGFSNGDAVLAHILPAARALDDAGIRAAALKVRVAVGGLPSGGGLDLSPPGTFDAGQNRRADSVIEQWISPHEMPVVWPPAFAEAPILPVDPMA
jgi:branched-chain amino acid transport system substrate-binding protein